MKRAVRREALRRLEAIAEERLREEMAAPPRSLAEELRRQDRIAARRDEEVRLLALLCRSVNEGDGTR